MPYKFNDARRHKFEKKRYRITNWASLRQRGDVTVWLSPQVEALWGPVAHFSHCQIDSGCWTHLSSESRKLLEWAMTRCVKLLLSDHMCDFDTFQCC